VSEYEPQHRAGDDDYGVEGSVVGRLNPMLSDAAYDKLKWVAQILLPALGTLYFTVAQIYGLPYAEQVVGTIVAVDAFLGVVLGLSSASYTKETEGKMIGFIDVEETQDGKKMKLNFPSEDPHDIVNHDKVTFKVRKN
jgi:hypothetical protein